MKPLRNLVFIEDGDAESLAKEAVFWICDGKDGHVAEITIKDKAPSYVHTNVTRAQAEDFCRKAAAAPEMFMALMRCRDFLDRNPELRMGGARELVCAALDKATKSRATNLRGYAGD